MDVLTELQALCADLASVRRSTPPPPFDDNLDCPLAIRHKKGEYILMKIGEDFEFLELWSFRLYLDAS